MFFINNPIELQPKSPRRLEHLSFSPVSDVGIICKTGEPALMEEGRQIVAQDLPSAMGFQSLDFVMFVCHWQIDGLHLTAQVPEEYCERDFAVNRILHMCGCENAQVVALS